MSTHALWVLGDAFAQATMAKRTGIIELAQKSAAQGERDGFYLLGYFYGIEHNAEKSRECYLIAAELGHYDSMISLGLLFDKTDPQRFVWFGKAAEVCSTFTIQMHEQIHNFFFGFGHANVVFAIGRVLKGHINYEKHEIFGREVHAYDLSKKKNYRKKVSEPPQLDLPNQALQFYNFQLQSYRKAVDYWTLVGLRNNVVKDIRKLIGKMIWIAREEAKYQFPRWKLNKSDGA